MKSARVDHGFTLIELLTVIAIIAVLAGMVFPVTQSIVEKSRTTACASNLRQLWTAVNAAAADNDNTYPRIKIDQNDDNAGEGALELKDTLSRYGITEKNLQCAADLVGPNNFVKYHTSYMWQPMVEDEFTGTVKVYRGRRSVATVAKPSRVPMLQDYDLVHPPEKLGLGKRMNVVYLDGHVTLR